MDGLCITVHKCSSHSQIFKTNPRRSGQAARALGAARLQHFEIAKTKPKMCRNVPPRAEMCHRTAKRENEPTAVRADSPPRRASALGGLFAIGQSRYRFRSSLFQSVSEL